MHNLVSFAPRELQINSEQALETVRTLGRSGRVQASVLNPATGVEQDRATRRTSRLLF